MQTTPIPPAALERVRKLIASGQRKILGIAAAPGAGKSTLAQGLRQAFGSAVQVLPMDGFHLANSELQRLGRAGRKGAPDTFDAEGYVHLLHRLRQQQAGQTIYAPDFRREIEEAVAGAIALEASTPLIVTEGNYLLLQDGAWQQVRTALDEAWYLELEPACASNGCWHGICSLAAARRLPSSGLPIRMSRTRSALRAHERGRLDSERALTSTLVGAAARSMKVLLG